MVRLASRRQFLGASVAAVGLSLLRRPAMGLAAAPEARSTAAKRPNIILVLVDDMPWYGTPVPMDESIPGSSMAFRRMPNLECFSKQSMQFRNAYSAAPICGPSRCCIQTGMSAARTGFSCTGGAGPWPKSDPGLTFDKKKEGRYKKLLVPESVKDIQPQWTTIAEALKPLGYTNAHFGKWHNWGGGPGEHGYDVHDGPTDNKDGNKKEAGDPKRMFSLTDRAIRFMEAQAGNGRPFYMQVSHYAQHAGAESLPETRAGYENDPRIAKDPDPRDRKQTADWAAMDENLDACMGKLFDKIGALGLGDNTYIVVTSDNGYRHWNEGHEPLRAGKWWLWEGGIRVPMWMRGPGIKPGTRCDVNVVGYDFFPTFIDLAGGDPSSLKNIDGASLKPLLLGNSVTGAFRNRSLYFHYPHYRTSAPHSAIIQGDYKLLHFYENPDERLLFHLAPDLGEQKNLASSEPEQTERMFGDLMGYLDEVSARMPKPNPEYSPDKLAEQERAAAKSGKQPRGDDE